MSSSISGLSSLSLAAGSVPPASTSATSASASSSSSSGDTSTTIKLANGSTETIVRDKQGQIVSITISAAASNSSTVNVTA